MSSSTLRFLTCGSVDDGKSTLIGRLLYDARVLFDDHLAALARDSKRHGTTGGDLDFALLVDGLEAEREQGITIDVAYRFFTTPARSFIVADAPGHEQYTRNMATGASSSELAVLLVDARKGVLVQTRRHAYIAALLGIRHVVLAVNKMDLASWSRDAFEKIARDFEAFAEPLGFASRVAIPMSARFGDNVCARSGYTPWHDGPTLLAHLESVDVEADLESRPFRMPVQWVNRPSSSEAPDFRGLSGTVSSGRVACGDAVVALGGARHARSAQATAVRRIVTYDGDLTNAVARQAVTLVLADDVDVSSGDVLASPHAPPTVSDELTAHVVWMAEEELLPGRRYALKLAAKTVSAQVTLLHHKVDVTTFAPIPAKTLHLNEIGLAHVALGEPIACDAYEGNRDTGGFILIDRETNQTVAAGMIKQAATASVRRQLFDVDQTVRAQMKGQRPITLWFTGLPSAGKSTIANLVERSLAARGRHTYLLDGDNVRRGLNRDLGFSDRDRVENVRRVAETAKLFVDAGLIVLVALISPFRSERRAAREIHPPGRFIEIFVDTPLEVCIARDPKGLYAKAKAGQLESFTGIGSPYEAPDAPDLVLRTTEHDAVALAEQVVGFLDRLDGS